MAKTFGTGADPKGLVYGGREGSGAAQIFRPSQAVQDFVTTQRQEGLQKQKQKQAEAKAKEEKLKLQRQEFDKLKEVELSSFSLNDQKIILTEYGGFLNMLAEKQANGIDINRDPEVLAGKQALLLKSEALKFQKQNYDKAVTALFNLSKDPNANREQVAEYAIKVQNYHDAPMEERDDASIVPNVEVVDPLKKLKEFEAIYVKPQKDFKERADGKIVKTETFDIENIRENLDRHKDEWWYKRNFPTEQDKEDYLEKIKNNQDLTGGGSKLEKTVNIGDGGYGNEKQKWTARPHVSTVSDLQQSIGRFGGVRGDVGTRILGNTQDPNYKNQEITIIDYTYGGGQRIPKKPILGTAPKLTIEKIGGGGQKVAEKPSMFNFAPNQVYQTKQDGVYYAVGIADITVNDPNTNKPLQYKDVNVGFIINDENIEDFTNQWGFPGETLEETMQRVNAKTSKKPTTKPSTPTNKTTIKSKSGKTLTVPK